MTKKPRIKVRSAKAKGASLQKWAVKKIAEVLGVDLAAIENKDDRPIQSRPASQTGVDVILSSEARKLFPFSVECKSGEHIGWQAAVRQARANMLPGTSWLVFLKTKQFRNPVVMLDANVFFEMVAGSVAWFEEIHGVADWQNGRDQENN